MDDSATSHTDNSLPSLESIPENSLPQPFRLYATLHNPLLTGAHDLEDVSFSDESEQEQPSIPPSDATDAADVASNSSIASENNFNRPYHNLKMRLTMKVYPGYSCTHIIHQLLHHYIIHQLLHHKMIFQTFTYADCTWMMKEEK